jgi:general nucleoside transport system permease protein
VAPPWVGALFGRNPRRKKQARTAKSRKAATTGGAA